MSALFIYWPRDKQVTGQISSSSARVWIDSSPYIMINIFKENLLCHGNAQPRPTNWLASLVLYKFTPYSQELLSLSVVKIHIFIVPTHITVSVSFELKFDFSFLNSNLMVRYIDHLLPTCWGLQCTPEHMAWVAPWPTTVLLESERYLAVQVHTASSHCKLTLWEKHKWPEVGNTMTPALTILVLGFAQADASIWFVFFLSHKFVDKLHLFISCAIKIFPWYFLMKVLCGQVRSGS